MQFQQRATTGSDFTQLAKPKILLVHYTPRSVRLPPRIPGSMRRDAGGGDRFPVWPLPGHVREEAAGKHSCNLQQRDLWILCFWAVEQQDGAPGYRGLVSYGRSLAGSFPVCLYHVGILTNVGRSLSICAFCSEALFSFPCLSWFGSSWCFPLFGLSFSLADS